MYICICYTVWRLQHLQLYSTEMLWAVNNPLLHDVVFVVSDDEHNTRRFFAHKPVVCARSAYFRAMLTGGMKVGSLKCISPPTLINF